MRRTVLVAVLAALVGAVVATPIAVYASHQFTDVSSSNIFHADIAWLADAGVTKGCNPPANTEFCPKDEVTRETMAAFLHRLAVNRVVDADTVDGQHASAFALEADLAADGGASCAGSGFLPNIHSVNYSGVVSRTADASSVISAGCAINLPHGATVTRVVASFDDTAPTWSAFCRLARTDVTGTRTGAGSGDWQELAKTGDTTGASGDQTVSTTDISHSVIDARRYAYWVECGMGGKEGDQEDIAINGVVVQYDLR